MVINKAVITLLVIGGFLLAVCGDFPQLHRALPGANGKPGYRVTSASKAADNTVQNKQHGDDGVGTDKQTHAGYHQKTMDFESKWTEAAFYSIISCVLVGLSGILPLVIIPLEAGPSLQSGVGSSMLKLLLSFAVGSLLGDVFLHLLPEAWATVNRAADPHWAHTVVGLWVIGGLLTFITIEKIFSETEEEEDEKVEEPVESKTNGRIIHQTTDDTSPNLRSRANGKAHQNGTSSNGVHHNGNGIVKENGTAHEEKENTCDEHSTEQRSEKNIHIAGYLNLLANFIDNFTHGLAVAGSYLISPKVGLCTTIAILLHEIPHEVGDFAILLRSGFDRWKAAKAQVVTASGGMLGALFALMSESAEKAGDKVASILPFTAGGFLYISLVTVVPELLKETSLKESVKQVLCIVLGVLSMMLVTVLFEG